MTEVLIEQHIKNLSQLETVIDEICNHHSLSDYFNDPYLDDFDDGYPIDEIPVVLVPKVTYRPVKDSITVKLVKEVNKLIVYVEITTSI